MRLFEAGVQLARARSARPFGFLPSQEWRSLRQSIQRPPGRLYVGVEQGVRPKRYPKITLGMTTMLSAKRTSQMVLVIIKDGIRGCS
ncbi:MAG: hypothetical protein K2W97_00635 [Chthoniobacterales bacterium]|nr:hypothetical protein [Chthoniobacterales bacterium]